MSLLALLPILGEVLDKVIPDAEKQAEAKYKMFELIQKGEFAALEADKAVALAQADINKEDAKSQSAWQRGWRPLVGYICALGLFYQFFMQPFLPWLAVTLGYPVTPMPLLDMETLLTLLLGMLGLGGFRTFEKVKGITK